MELKSAALDAIKNSPGAPAKGDFIQWESWLRGRARAGVLKNTELEYLDVYHWLEGRDVTTRAELVDYVERNQLVINEILLSTPSDTSVLNVSRTDRKLLETNEFKDSYHEETTATNYNVIVNSIGHVTSIKRSDGTSLFEGKNYSNLRANEAASVIESFIRNNPPLPLPGSNGISGYDDLKVPGGKNYGELIITLPRKQGAILSNVTRDEAVDAIEYGGTVSAFSPNGELGSTAANLEALNNIPGNWTLNIKAVRDSELNFKSSHYGYDNVLCHVRFQEREGDSRERILLVEEIQSDWHQLGRKHGYRADPKDYSDYREAIISNGLKLGIPRDKLARAADTVIYDTPNHNGSLRAWETISHALDGTEVNPNEVHDITQRVLESTKGTIIPDAPFKSTEQWSLLAMKRITSWAVENGFNSIAWTSADIQLDRYSLKQQVDTLRVRRMPWAGSTELEVTGFNFGDITVSKAVSSEFELATLIGKAPAEKVIDQLKQADSAYLYGPDVSIGTSGMRGFYDIILPKAVGKWLKQFDSKVVGNELSDVLQPNSGPQISTSIHYFPITRKLREAVSDGLPMFTRSKESIDGMSALELEGQLRKGPLGRAIGDLIDKGLVNIHESGNTFRGIDAGDTALTTPDKKIHLFADRISTSSATPVLLHEAFHAFTEPLIGTKSWSKLQDRLGILFDKAKENTSKDHFIWRTALMRVMDAATPTTRDIRSHCVEEFGAYAIEVKEQASKGVRRWVRDTTDAVKAWTLKSLGLQLGEVTPGQLSSLTTMAIRDAGEMAASRTLSFDNQHQSPSELCSNGALFSKAFHGTSYRFDNFSLSHVGNGQGAQTFGWGLYFATELAVAEFYKDKSELFASSRGIASTGEKHLYEVDVPNKNVLLDWNKSIEEQPKHIRDALIKWRRENGDSFSTGEQAYRAISFNCYMQGAKNPDKSASHVLQSLGIPGLRYLDGLSGGSKRDTHNYVVWDETVISITAVNNQMVHRELQLALDLTPDEVNFTKAYQGSPVAVTRINMDKIGSGEGAQMYGHGAYFTDKKEIAEWYRDVLQASSLTVMGQPIPSARGGVRDTAAIENTLQAMTQLSPLNCSRIATYLSNKNSITEVLDYIKDKGEDYRRCGYIDAANECDILYEAVQREKIEVKQLNTGAVMDVEIPDSTELLHWDLKMPDQPPRVQEALLSMPESVLERVAGIGGVAMRRGVESGAWRYATGENIYNSLHNAYSNGLSDDELKDGIRDSFAWRHASIILESAGIKGVQYLDGASRYKPQAVWRSKNDENLYPSDVKDIVETALRLTNHNKDSAIDLIKRGSDDTRSEAYDLTIQALESGAISIDQSYNYVIWDENSLKVTAVDGQHLDLLSAKSTEEAISTHGFKEWFGNSVVVDDDGDPLIVHRGEHGLSDSVAAGVHSRFTAITYSSYDAAKLYAESTNEKSDQIQQSRIASAFLSLQNPIINDPFDPFIDLSVISKTLGLEEAMDTARRLEEQIMATGNWEENFDSEYSSLDEMFEKDPALVNELYIDAYLVLDNNDTVAALKKAGFDGAIHAGSGGTLDSPEYKVFSPEQVIVLDVDFRLNVSPTKQAYKPALTKDQVQLGEDDEYRYILDSGKKEDPLLIAQFVERPKMFIKMPMSNAQMDAYGESLSPPMRKALLLAESMLVNMNSSLEKSVGAMTP